MSLFLNQRDSVIFDINNDGSSELLALKKSPYVLSDGSLYQRSI